MSTYRLSISILVLFIVLVSSLTGNAFTQPHHQRGFWTSFTEEQKQAIHDKIAELREQGATHDEIHEAVAELLDEYGIELPDPEDRPHGPFGHGPEGFWSDLTAEQREAIQNKIAEMKAQGATREEIHEAAAELLEEFGIELPEHWDRPHGPGGSHMGSIWTDLTAEQREIIRSRMREMRFQGATKEEIRVAVSELLESFGIEFPKDSEPQLIKPPTPESHITAHNYPNPFNPETYINYTLNVSGDVKIQIYNITGQIVRKFTVGYQQAGSYCVLWDGCDRTGVPVASGVYLYRIEAGPYSVMNRMMLLK